MVPGSTAAQEQSYLQTKLSRSNRLVPMYKRTYEINHIQKGTPGSDEQSTSFMWNFTYLEEFLWKRKENKILKVHEDNYTVDKTDRKEHTGNTKSYHEENETENRYYMMSSSNSQSECSIPNQSYRMKLSPNDVPENAVIRRIRSYSVNPDLSAIALNSSSMTLVTRVQLLQTSCLTDKLLCETYAMCDTDLGHMTCRCKRGFYVKDRKCRACATSCPDGYYMSQACTSSSDVICRPCSTCTGALYEVAACSSTQDTICVGAAFPVQDVKWNKLIKQSAGSEVSLTSSQNVFHEKIGGIKKLDVSMYIPNNAQVQEFDFQRESGLHIKIKVSSLYLVPQYIDLDHEDDFKFIDRDRFQLEKAKKQYRAIQKDFCRHQLPDHYKLVLYITRNHTSAADAVKCNSHDPDIPACPDGYKDGDIFLNRHINTECPYERNQYFERFEHRKNNIYCTHTTSLFKNTFGLTPEDISNFTYPTEDCNKATEDCNKCLKFPSCRSYEGQCCDINCFTQGSCQKSFSDDCPKKPVECASGDIHNFMLEPVFSSVNDRFLCHMKYKKPRHLYQMEYTVRMLGIDYTFPKRIKFAKGDISFNQRGVFTSEFITASHYSFPKISEEIILIGSENDKITHRPTKFLVHELKKPHDFNKRKKFRIRPHRSNLGFSHVYSTNIQVERPFMYSSSTFSKGGCINKNFTNIYPPQPLYEPSSIRVDPSITITGAGIEYETPVHNITRSAYIRMFIDNSSILTYFQDNLPKSVLDGSSVTGGLLWNPKTQMWTIQVQGRLQSCPGYLTVDMYDQFMEGKLAHFDVFIKCPVDFHLTFDLKTPNTDLPNVFVAQINDSYISHYVLLSMMHPPFYPPSEYPLTESTNELYQFPWLPIIATLVITSIVFSAFVAAFLVIKRQRPIQTPEVKKYISPQTTTYIGAKDDERNVNQPLTLTLFSKPVSKHVSCTLCALYVVYAIMFTFSTFLGVFYLVQGPLVSNLTIVSNTSAKIHESVSSHMAKISQYEDQELVNAFNGTFNRMKACSAHLKQDVARIDTSIRKNVHDVLNKFYSGQGLVKTAIDISITEKSKLIADKFQKFLTETDSVLDKHFDYTQQKYIELLENFRDNSWLKFSKERFAEQQFILGEEKTFQGLKDFMKWLEVDGVEPVLNFKDIIKNRLKKSVAELIPAGLQISPETVLLKKDPEVPVNFKSEVRSQVLETGETLWVHTNSSSDGKSNGPQDDKMMSKAKMISQMKQIILPVFICLFIIMDAFMLGYRFVWLWKILRKAKMGVDIKVPTDHVAEKIQFWQTGCNNRKLEHASKENPYNFYAENKEDMWSGKNDPIQLYANTAQKSKQEILREIWNKKQKEKRISYTESTPHSFIAKTIFTLSTFLYKHLIAPILWRFVLVGAFVLVICLVTKATSDLVSIETATFLIDTKSIIPQLHRQVDITNSLLIDVTSDLNIILKEHKSLVDSEVASINHFLTSTINAQNEVLQLILSDLCSTTHTDICSPSLLRVQQLITSCNFLPVTSSPFKEMDEGLFVHYLHSELVPLVSTLRQILLNTCYILFVYACLMLICHMLIRIVIFYLIKKGQLPKAMIYLVSNTNDCWKVNEGSNTKSMYRSNSCIESCESGVVGDIEDHRESNM
ncbi:unnamed protein product [Mytilus edulis]|uniref:TNFR-Cys domain-containing protein n=1 Tax=Mytilus edulis TaxID=6550 RepID=A0A8S3VAI5_MYTED|nr:unnamed protein product [Mytilus edulis]